MGMSTDIEFGVSMTCEDSTYCIRIFDKEEGIAGVVVQVAFWIAVEDGIT